jgi:thiol-disulfide isomerase/thioredoxin
MFSRLPVVCLMVLSFIVSGCLKETDSEKIKAGGKSIDEIPVIDETWLEEKIKNRNNKILFINVWATWCQPCVEEFPDLVEIYKKHKDSDFEFLSISVDHPSEIESKVKPFLEEQKSEFPVVVAGEKKAEEIINLLNPEWSGAIPVTLIYDKNGIRQVFILGAQDFKYFDNSIAGVKKL